MAYSAKKHFISRLLCTKSWTSTQVFRIATDYFLVDLAFIVYWGILLFGYDAGVAGGVVSQPYFQQEFGLRDADGTQNKERTNEVSSIMVSILQAGAFFGALGSAPASAKFGRKMTLLFFTLVFSLGAILATAAHDYEHYGLELIYAGRVISGFGIGGISAVAPAFVSECSPKEVRGRITGLFQIMVAAGVMLSYFINFGISLYEITGPNVWRIPFGIQLVPASIMFFGLLTVKESPRYLFSVGHTTSALHTLAYLRKEPPWSERVMHEMAEIEAQAEEERDARKDLGFWDALKTKGESVRFRIAFSIFVLQQWSGQNSVGYYAPQIFETIGFTGTKNSLLASGVYGIVKLLATTIFVLYLVETLGRRLPLLISSLGMGILFLAIGVILKAHPPLTSDPNPAVEVIADPPTTSAAKAMAALLYIYVCFYSVGWGPLPWIYVAEIFPTRTRHYGLAVASASQWFWTCVDFVVAKATPDLIARLGYEIFFLFGVINIGAMAVFAFFLPETKGRSLEDMDIIFGAITAEARAAHVAESEERAQEHDIEGTNNEIDTHPSESTRLLIPRD
ncbi:hypothetical protein C0995_014886 [Termitomyces sp. Mi166|nr:hypothetical protein C0995_014886 [Termitomyces sp. Mi166\